MSAAAVTAIVVVHGSPAATVANCMRSLLDSRDVDLEIVLVDNASPDGGAACAAWAETPGVRVVHAPSNGGFAAGVNIGVARRRRTGHVWLLNDDATVEPDAIATCVTMLDANPSAVAIAPRVMLVNDPDRIDSIGVVLRPNGEAFNAYIGQRWNDQVGDGDEVLGPCFSAALLRSNSLYQTSVGPLDERYHLYYEDIDWVLRARTAGLISLACTSAVVRHQHAASTRRLGEPARYELVQRNLLLCVTKNFGVRRAAAAWGSRVLVHGKGVITGPYRVERLRAIGRALVGAPSAIIGRRALVKRTRTPRRDQPSWFAFAEGQQPLFDASTYRATDID